MPLTSPDWTAVIPLRAGSKGLPGKNTRLLAGKPLYRHAVDQALQAGAQPDCGTPGTMTVKTADGKGTTQTATRAEYIRAARAARISAVAPCSAAPGIRTQNGASLSAAHVTAPISHATSGGLE